MRANPKLYEKVAEHCSHFSAKSENDSFTSSTSECKCSCTNCNHFTKSSYCNIDLFDQIVDGHNF